MIFCTILYIELFDLDIVFILGERNCSRACKDGLCHASNGSCLDCPATLYGDQCTLPCNTNCQGGTCDKNGRCISCSSGFWGDMCDKVCGNCTNCDRTTGCQACPVGKWGNSCQNNCNANCQLNQCSKEDGSCDCNVGFYGVSCDKVCNNSGHCITNACDKLTGDCSGNCVDGWYGTKCQIQCPTQCRRGLQSTKCHVYI